MSYLQDPRFIRQLIMDHYENPRNKRFEPDYPSDRESIDTCIDDITVQAKIKDGVIDDVAFSGQACTIATASTSMMTEMLKGKTVEEAMLLIEEYNKMIHLHEFDEEKVGETIAFKNVGRQANRIHCATLGWRAITNLIQESEGDHE